MAPRTGGLFRKRRNPQESSEGSSDATVGAGADLKGVDPQAKGRTEDGAVGDSTPAGLPVKKAVFKKFRARTSTAPTVKDNLSETSDSDADDSDDSIDSEDDDVGSERKTGTISRRDKRHTRGLVSSTKAADGEFGRISGAEILNEGKAEAPVQDKDDPTGSRKRARFSATVQSDEEADDRDGKRRASGDIVNGDAALKMQGEDEDEPMAYKGLSKYREFVNRKDGNPTQKSAGSSIRAGQLKAAANVRITSRFDYQQDICKDYQRTGFCGYGDGCIYLHERGKFKTGWQLEKEWEEKQRQAKADKSRKFVSGNR